MMHLDRFLADAHTLAYFVHLEGSYDVLASRSVAFEGLDTGVMVPDAAPTAGLIAAAAFTLGEKGGSYAIEDLSMEDGAVQGSWVLSAPIVLRLPVDTLLHNQVMALDSYVAADVVARLAAPAVLLGRSDRFDATLAAHAADVAKTPLGTFNAMAAATLMGAVALSKAYGGWDKVPLQQAHGLPLLVGAKDQDSLLLVQATFLRTA